MMKIIHKLFFQNHMKNEIMARFTITSKPLRKQNPSSGKILLLFFIYLIHILLHIFFQNTLPPQPVAIIDIRLGVSLKICPFCRRLTSKRNGIRSQRYSIPSALILDPVSRKAPRLITVSIRH